MSIVINGVLVVIGFSLGFVSAMCLAGWAWKTQLEKQKDLERLYTNTILGLENIQDGRKKVMEQEEELERLLDNLPLEKN